MKRSIEDFLRIPWQLIVSFKTELLSEHLIETYCHRVRSHLGLPLVRRLIVDNDICLSRVEVERAESIIARDPVGWSGKIFRVIATTSRSFLQTSRTLPRGDLQRLTDRELASALRLWFRAYGEAVGLIGIPARLDAVLERSVHAALAQYPIEDREGAFRTIAHADKPSGVTKERIALMQLVGRIPNLAPTRAERIIAHHARKFTWVQTTLLLGDLYAPDAIQTKIEELRTERNLPAKLKDLHEDIRRNRRQCALLTAQYQFAPEHRRLFDALREAVWFRTARLEWLNQGCALARPLLSASAERLGLSHDEIIYCSPEEILGSLRTRSALPKTSEIRRRMRKYGMGTLDGKHGMLFLGEDVERLKRAITPAVSSRRVQGLPAFQGVVRGPVRFVRDRTEIGKVRRGDILVTKLTTPDFLPAMERAAAIVTDLGGITSHAAIVARELHKPCIVGTRNATAVLRDGNTVEVDAEKGVVKVLKRA